MYYSFNLGLYPLKTKNQIAPRPGRKIRREIELEFSFALRSGNERVDKVEGPDAAGYGGKYHQFVIAVGVILVIGLFFGFKPALNYFGVYVRMSSIFFLQIYFILFRQQIRSIRIIILFRIMGFYAGADGNAGNAQTDRHADNPAGIVVGV